MIELDFRLDTSDIDRALKMRIIDNELAQTIFATDLKFREVCQAYLALRSQLLLCPVIKISGSAEPGSGKNQP